MRIIGFGAHPDDAEIYFLGLLLAARARGDAIGWAVATDGAKGGGGDPAELAARRRREAEEAAADVGVQPLFLDRPDGGLADDAELLQRVEAALVDLAPDLVVTHAPNDYHPDHRALAAAVVAAASFRVPVLHADTFAGVGFAPSHYVDVTAQMAAKRAAIRRHGSQRPERFVAAAETLARLRAAQCNAPPDNYAEAYRFEPRFPFADIRDLLPPAPPVRPLGAAPT